MPKSFVRYGVFAASLLAAALCVRAGDDPAASGKFGTLKVSVVDTDKNPQAGVLIQLLQIENDRMGGGGGSQGGHGKSAFGQGGAIEMAPPINQEETKDFNEKIRVAKKTGSDGKVIFEHLKVGRYRVAQIRNGKIHQSEAGKVTDGGTAEVNFEMIADKTK